MATYAELITEPYWNREIVTPEIEWLGDELCRLTSRPQYAFGTKGNNRHLRGAHRSQEWILGSRYCTSRTYTVQSGLTATQARHICGVDFQPANWGTVLNHSRMIIQTGRIIVAMKAGLLNEVREVFGTVDGITVTGWNNDTNRKVTSDDSHLEHWHLTLDRKQCGNKNLMRRIVAVILGEKVEENVNQADAELLVTTLLRRTIGSSGPTVGVALQDGYRFGKETHANMQGFVGKDFVDEQVVIDGVLNGLSTRDASVVANMLRAAWSPERIEELKTLL